MYNLKIWYHKYIMQDLTAITTREQAKDYIYGLSDNIIVEDVHRNGEYCYVFFSSNGLDESDDVEGFIRNVADGNRYEWRSIAGPIKQNRHTGRVIFVRDVYMCFYMHGVSPKADSIADTVKRLEELTSDREWNIVTVGISSGGYMAMIAGMALHAHKIYNISGQYFLKPRIPDLYDEFCVINPEYGDIIHLVREYDSADIEDKSDIFYFCPIGCDHDRQQYEQVKDISCVKVFLFPDKKHAATVYPFNFPDLLMMSERKLGRLCNRYNGRMINKKEFLFRTMTFRGWGEFAKRAMRSRFRVSLLKDAWDVKKG